MKTAQIMTRNLNGLPVRQNHKSGMFNANDLLKIYNEQNPKAMKRMQDYIDNKATVEYMNYLATVLEPEVLNHAKKRELEFDLQEPVKLKNIMMTSRGKYGGTWMQQHLFIDFAMWLSLPFKHWAITCVGDKLIKLRDSAGDSFKDVNCALTEMYGEQRQQVYIQEAKMINEFVFEDGKGGQRNGANEDQLDLLNKLQSADIKLIHKGVTFEGRKKNLGIFKSLLPS